MGVEGLERALSLDQVFKSPGDSLPPGMLRAQSAFFREQFPRVAAEATVGGWGRKERRRSL